VAAVMPVFDVPRPHRPPSDGRRLKFANSVTERRVKHCKRKSMNVLSLRYAQVVACHKAEVNGHRMRGPAVAMPRGQQLICTLSTTVENHDAVTLTVRSMNPWEHWQYWLEEMVLFTGTHGWSCSRPGNSGNAVE